MTPELLTIDTVAERLQVSSRTVRREIARKNLRAVRVGGQLRVSQTALDEYLRRNEIGQQTRAKRLAGWGG